MDPNIFAGQWKELKGKVKVQWGRLTDDDLKQIDGKKDMLVGAIQKRYGYTLDQTKKTVDDWLSRVTH